MWKQTLNDHEIIATVEFGDELSNKIPKQKIIPDPKILDQIRKRWNAETLNPRGCVCDVTPKNQKYKKFSRPWNLELGFSYILTFWALGIDSAIRLFTAHSSELRSSHGTEHVLTDQYKCSRLAIIDTFDTHNVLITPLCTERWSSQVLSVALTGCS